MKSLYRSFAIAASALLFVAASHAAGIDGKWKTEFDSQIGQQKYTYELNATGEKLTGRAAGERADGSKSDVAITEGKSRTTMCSSSNR